MINGLLECEILYFESLHWSSIVLCGIINPWAYGNDPAWIKVWMTSVIVHLIVVHVDGS